MLNLVGSPRSRKKRGTTVGKKLAAKIAGMGSRISIKSIVGGRRPLNPQESSYLASEVACFIKAELPIFSSWKHHIAIPSHLERLVQNLHVSYASPGNGTYCHIALSH